MRSFRLSLIITLIAVLAMTLASCAPAPTPTAAPAAAPKATEAAKAPAAASSPTIDRIKKAGKLVVAADATFAPMEFKNEKGEIVGADIDIATEIAKDLGVKLEIANTNWDAIFASLKAGKTDMIISSVTITDERSKEMSFSKTYFAGGQVIMVKADNSTVKGPADLKGKVVSVQIDTTGQIAAEKIDGIKELKKYDGGADTCLAVDTGKVEAAIIDKMVAADYVKQHPSVKLVDSKPFVTEDIGIAMQLDAKDLVEAVNKSIDSMKADGRLDKILDKYGLK